MLREVNHRVKNNLQLISSLLSLQQGGIGDERLRDQLAQADRRIMAIARVREHLYRGAQPTSTIEFGSYLRAHLEIANDGPGARFTVSCAPTHPAC